MRSSVDISQSAVYFIHFSTANILDLYEKQKSHYPLSTVKLNRHGPIKNWTDTVRKGFERKGGLAIYGLI